VSRRWGCGTRIFPRRATRKCASCWSGRRARRKRTMVALNRSNLSERLRSVVLPVRSHGDVMAPILDLVGDARVVMIGEASHGTDEFYRYRAEITKRLISDMGFTAVCAEAD